MDDHVEIRRIYRAEHFAPDLDIVALCAELQQMARSLGLEHDDHGWYYECDGLNIPVEVGETIAIVLAGRRGVSEQEIVDCPRCLGEDRGPYPIAEDVGHCRRCGLTMEEARAFVVEPSVYEGRPPSGPGRT
jgi:hypothetical protein